MRQDILNNLVVFEASYQSDGKELARRIFAPIGCADIADALAHVQEDAARSGFNGHISDVPASFFRKYGLRELVLNPRDNAFIEAEDSSLVHLAHCRDCSAFDAGTCFVNGSRVSGDQFYDCEHGTGGVKFVYGGGRFGPFISDTGMDPDEMLIYILDGSYTDLGLQDMRKKMLELAKTEFLETHIPVRWEIEKDNG